MSILSNQDLVALTGGSFRLIRLSAANGNVLAFKNLGISSVYTSSSYMNHYLVGGK